MMEEKAENIVNEQSPQVIQEAEIKPIEEDILPKVNEIVNHNPENIEKIEEPSNTEYLSFKKDENNVGIVDEGSNYYNTKRLIISYDTQENREILKKKIGDLFEIEFINNFDEKNIQFYKEVEEMKLSFYNIYEEAETLKLSLQKPTTSINVKNNKIDASNKNDNNLAKKNSGNESFISTKASGQKEKRSEVRKPNGITKSVDLDREGLRSNKLNFNTTIVKDKDNAATSTPKSSKTKANFANSTLKTLPNTTVKEKEEENEKSSEKAKILDKLKTSTKIKRPLTSNKSNANTKTIATGYDTNVPTSSTKSPLASNFADKSANKEKDKKNKESKDDFNLKHKKALDTHVENKLDKTHRVEKKDNLHLNTTESEASNLINNLTVKKSANKIITTAKKNVENKNGKTDVLDLKDKVEKTPKTDKLKEKKDTKIISKVEKGKEAASKTKSDSKKDGQNKPKLKETLGEEKPEEEKKEEKISEENSPVEPANVTQEKNQENDLNENVEVKIDEKKTEEKAIAEEVVVEVPKLVVSDENAQNIETTDEKKENPEEIKESN